MTPSEITRNMLIPGHSDVVIGCRDRSGEYYATTGKIEAILTRSNTHPHGIKVKLKSGSIGRVKAVLSIFVPISF